MLSDGVLTVSGSGECTNAWMNNYSPNNVTKIVIGSGITSIGRAAFQGCAYVKSVDIANGVTKICRGGIVYDEILSDTDFGKLTEKRG